MYSDADATVMPGQTSVQIVPHRMDDRSQGPGALYPQDTLEKGQPHGGHIRKQRGGSGNQCQVLQKGALRLIIRLPCQKTFHTR